MTETIPEGFHRMPDGSIMADEDHIDEYKKGGKVRKRCPKGKRRSKKTGKCVKVKKTRLATIPERRGSFRPSGTTGTLTADKAFQFGSGKMATEARIARLQNLVDTQSSNLSHAALQKHLVALGYKPVPELQREQRYLGDIVDSTGARFAGAPGGDDGNYINDSAFAADRNRLRLQRKWESGAPITRGELRRALHDDAWEGENIRYVSRDDDLTFADEEFLASYGQGQYLYDDMGFVDDIERARQRQLRARGGVRSPTGGAYGGPAGFARGATQFGGGARTERDYRYRGGAGSESGESGYTTTTTTTESDDPFGGGGGLARQYTRVGREPPFGQPNREYHRGRSDEPSGHLVGGLSPWAQSEGGGSSVSSRATNPLPFAYGGGGAEVEEFGREAAEEILRRRQQREEGESVSGVDTESDIRRAGGEPEEPLARFPDDAIVRIQRDPNQPPPVARPRGPPSWARGQGGFTGEPPQQPEPERAETETTEEFSDIGTSVSGREPPRFAEQATELAGQAAGAVGTGAINVAQTAGRIGLDLGTGGATAIYDRLPAAERVGEVVVGGGIDLATGAGRAMYNRLPEGPDMARFLNDASGLVADAGDYVRGGMRQVPGQEILGGLPDRPFDRGPLGDVPTPEGFDSSIAGTEDLGRPEDFEDIGEEETADPDPEGVVRAFGELEGGARVQDLTASQFSDLAGEFYPRATPPQRPPTPLTATPSDEELFGGALEGATLIRGRDEQPTPFRRPPASPAAGPPSSESGRTATTDLSEVLTEEIGAVEDLKRVNPDIDPTKFQGTTPRTFRKVEEYFGEEERTPAREVSRLKNRQAHAYRQKQRKQQEQGERQGVNVSVEGAQIDGVDIDFSETASGFESEPASEP